jgi:hypothetical protein
VGVDGALASDGEAGTSAAMSAAAALTAAVLLRLGIRLLASAAVDEAEGNDAARALTGRAAGEPKVGVEVVPLLARSTDAVRLGDGRKPAEERRLKLPAEGESVEGRGDGDQEAEAESTGSATGLPSLALTLGAPACTEPASGGVGRPRGRLRGMGEPAERAGAGIPPNSGESMGALPREIIEGEASDDQWAWMGEG